MWFVFPGELAGVHGFLAFRPLEVVRHQGYSLISLLIPGHVDMHKQIRVLLSLMPKKRINSVRFALWKAPVGTWYTTASEHWTGGGTERWAEAFQNEIGDDLNQPATELIAAAAPGTTELRTEFMANVAYRGGPAGVAEIYWIKYQLANAGSVRFDIVRLTPTPVPVKTIDEGYDGLSPAGYYVREQFSTGVGSLDEKLLATTAFLECPCGLDDSEPP